MKDRGVYVVHTPLPNVYRRYQRLLVRAGYVHTEAALAADFGTPNRCGLSFDRLLDAG